MAFILEGDEDPGSIRARLKALWTASTEVVHLLGYACHVFTKTKRRLDSESNPRISCLSCDSLEQTLRMHKTLAEFDDRGSLSREALIAMPQRDHWHPKMMWYGPAGIGTTHRLEGFVDGHQLPFRVAFHRRQGTFDEVMAERARNGAGHYIRIGDGPYSVTGGWPSVYAMHMGAGFGGMPATGKPVFMRVMDFYLHHEGLIRENWVPIDLLHLFGQMGLDLIGRMSLLTR